MKKLFPFILLPFFLTNTVFAETVLVTIGKSGQVTQQQLEVAMSAAPFATQFPSMDENDQAYLRGDLLLRMARAEALYMEAVDAGINQSTAFKHEMGNFKTSLLAQQYLSNLRKQIEIPEHIEQKLLEQTKGNSDALVAAKSVYMAKNFSTLKDNSIDALIKDSKIKTYFDRLDQSPKVETVLADGNELIIKYGDLIAIQMEATIDKQRVIDKVNEWIRLTLMAKAAVAQGINIDPQLQEYAHNLAIRLLLAEKESEWIANENTLLDFFQNHPNIGYIPERRQVGQIVLGSQEDAEKFKTRIDAGESLFELAGHYSIDPYGKQRSGDMGWLTVGQGNKAIEAALKNLKDNEISEIIQTNKGWHIITIVNRKPSERKSYAAIKDRVRQKFIAEKMAIYLKEVETRYPLKWKIDNHS